ncbi:RDD family protein [Pleomorphovibrio marinus]|uniref:RDD family protein n=1 Tax=Pleomorphovibrio marinus TaxID=2164132 RepID=UPI000E0A3A94|nr:RDD family protein [Pleomorphovibrio marinus]
MDNFQIETAQNIQIDQPTATLTERIFAYLIDLLIQVGYWVAALFLLGLTGMEEGVSPTIIYMLLAVPSFTYYLLFEWLMSGQTPGKAAMEIRVVMLDGTRPGFISCFIRWVIRPIDITLTSGGVAILLILLNSRRQRLGDLAAGTTVNSEKKHYSLQESLYTEVPEDHEPIYPQVTALTDKQMQDIQFLLLKSLRAKNYGAIRRLSQKVEKLLEVTPTTKPLEFLQQVVKDYIYLTQR